MQWLEYRLYEKQDIQDTWSVEQWRELWAQLVKVLEEGLSTMTHEIVNDCTNPRQRAVYIMTLEKKEAAEQEIKTWDLSRMSYRVKLLIKAQIMQRVRYKYALKTFSNLRELEDISAPSEPFDIRLNDNTYKNLKAYYNLNIYV